MKQRSQIMITIPPLTSYPQENINLKPQTTKKHQTEHKTNPKIPTLIKKKKKSPHLARREECQSGKPSVLIHFISQSINPAIRIIHYLQNHNQIKFSTKTLK